MYHYNLGIRFQAVVASSPDQIAIWFSETDFVSYGELNQHANRWARLLINRGAGSRDVICVSGEKSLFTFACMLGCLKIGAIYSILDPDSPGERLRKILLSCKPRLLVADQVLLHKLQTLDLDIEVVEKDPNKLQTLLNEFEGHNLKTTDQFSGSTPAYIMFTSGSTGIPKGAVMTHANVLNLIAWSEKTFNLTQDDVLTNVNPLYFDNSVFDFYSSLFNGARLAPFTKDEVKDPKILVEKVDRAGCTLWFSVPSLLIFLQTMRAADGKHLKSIRRFVFGGEGYPKAKLKTLYDAYADSSELFNVYGPTECTCICSCYKLSSPDFNDLQGLAPLGQIAENFEFLIVDEAGELVPNGETGELCLMGPNVGMGYYDDPLRTAASFVQNPLNDKFAETMYKTGDLVKLNPLDGKLYIQGRKDNQIKHMGYRIELEDIEAALNCLDYVSEAAVLHTSINGLSRIVAIISTSNLFDANLIRRDLKQIIPEYMIPSVFHCEEILPKNPNGKVDRRYLGEKYLPAPAVKEIVGL
jgi:D-alanine--poly(phosphoribitol) ligase subunit 1